MRIRKRRNQPPPLEPVAGNGLLDRRALLGRGIVLAGAMTTGAGASLDRRCRRAAQGRPMEPGDGRGRSAAADGVPFREGRGAHAQQSQ